MLSAKKVLNVNFFSVEGVDYNRCQWKRENALLKNTAKTWYWRNWKKYYQKWRCVSKLLELHGNAPAHMSATLRNFCKREGNRFPTFSLFTRYCPLWLLPFSECKTLIGRWRYQFRQALGSAVSQYFTTKLNQRTVTHSGSGFINWNYAFLGHEKKKNCDYLHFEHSQSKQAILFKHPS